MSDNALVLLTLSPILIGIVIPAVVEFAGAVA